jgi:hypothetical protein
MGIVELPGVREESLFLRSVKLIDAHVFIWELI